MIISCRRIECLDQSQIIQINLVKLNWDESINSSTTPPMGRVKVLIPMENHVIISCRRIECLDRSQITQINLVKLNWDKSTNSSTTPPMGRVKMLIPMESHVIIIFRRIECLDRSQVTQINLVKLNWDESTNKLYKSRSTPPSPPNFVHKPKSLPTQARCWRNETRFKSSIHPRSFIHASITPLPP